MTDVLSFTGTEIPADKRGRKAEPNPYLPIAKQCADNRAKAFVATLKADSLAALEEQFKTVRRHLTNASKELGVTIRTRFDKDDKGTSGKLTVWAVDKIKHKDKTEESK